MRITNNTDARLSRGKAIQRFSLRENIYSNFEQNNFQLGDNIVHDMIFAVKCLIRATDSQIIHRQIWLRFGGTVRGAECGVRYVNRAWHFAFRAKNKKSGRSCDASTNFGEKSTYLADRSEFGTGGENPAALASN